MTVEDIKDAIATVVRRYAKIRSPSEEEVEITENTRPYAELGMDSLHDVNIACELEIMLGVRLPSDKMILASENRALSISQAAQNIARQLSATH